MIIIVNKTDHVFMAFGKKLDYMSNGYPRLVDENIAFPTEMVNVFEGVTIPSGVETNKYCYTESEGFTENPNYVEPNKYNIANELLETIQADYTEELIDEGVI